MVKAEITNNICLVEICTERKIRASAATIRGALKDGGLFPLFMSGSGIFGTVEKFIVAIDSQDLFPVMNILGAIRHKAGITNYSINCSNSMIKWKNMKNTENEGLWEGNDSIKLIYMWEDSGICFCESSFAKTVCALVTDYA